MVGDNQAFEMAFVTGGNRVLRTLDTFFLVLTKLTPGHWFRISDLSGQSFICLRGQFYRYSGSIPYRRRLISSG